MADDLIDRLRLEAQIHAQEARTANATIAEIYQLCSGGKGEPGNWNGAEPVRALVAERDALAATLRQQAARVDVRAAVQRMAGMLEQGEWADLLSTDPDVARLNAAISAALAQNTQVAGCSLGCKDGQCLAQDHGCPSECVKPKAAQNTQGYGEAVAWLRTVTQGDGETDQALSFSRDSFPLDTQLGFRSLGAVPLYLHAERARVPDVDAMVNRFLGWRLPDDFAPDFGISFDRDVPGCWPGSWPTGTNLLNADQAKAMLEYVLAAPSQRAEVDRG
jgi:hypothetical protein